MRNSSLRRDRTLLAAGPVVPVVALGLLAGALADGPRLRPASRTATVTLPRSPSFTWYQVDPGWPNRPGGTEWGDMPGIAIDSRDRVWTFTRAEPPVQVYDTSGKFLFSWGEGVVSRAHHIKIGPGGHVWISDIGNHTIRKCTTDGKVLLTLGTPGKAGVDETHLDKPTDMAMSPEGDIFVSDGYGNNRVVHFDRNGKFVKAWGELGTGPGEFHLPHAIAIDSRGRLYVADRTNARVQVFDQEGQFLDEWRNKIVPWGFCVTKDDAIWVCGSSPMPSDGKGVPCCPPRDQIFMKFDSQGRVLQLWTIPKGADGQEKPGELNWVHAMALDSHGNIYAGDIRGQRAQKFTVRH